MQKKLLAVAVLSAFSGLAAAQSANVTLYGTLLGDVQLTGATGGDGTSTINANGVPNGANSSLRLNAIGPGLPLAATPLGAAPSTAGNLGNRYLNATPGAAGTSSAGLGTNSLRLRENIAGSNLGFRGTEDLGNGLSAWFQLELAVNIGGGSALGGAAASHNNAPSFRNSAVGLRSNTWGTVLFGQWDLPFNVAYGRNSTSGRIAAPGTTTTGSLMGNSFLGQGTVSSQDLANFCATAGVNATAAGCFAGSTSFDRRQNGTIQWWSPNWNGFDMRASYSMPSGSIQADNGFVGGKILPSIWDLSFGYANGGLDVIYAYERQKDLLAVGAISQGGFASGVGTGAWQIGSVASPTTTALAVAAGGASQVTGSTSTGHRLGAKYTFPLAAGSLAFSALWESLTWNLAYGTAPGVSAVAAGTPGDLTQLRKKAWKIGSSYSFGNHIITGDYYRANNMTGSITGKTTAAGAAAIAGNAFDGSASGARQWVLGYNYMLSKRTSTGVYYNQTNNDTNASYGGQGFGAISAVAGQTAKSYGFQLRHSF